MRHPRVMIFNFRGQSCDELTALFRRRGFETTLFKKPEDCALMLSGREKRKTCLLPVPCTDIMVIVEDDEQLAGADFLAQQARSQCKLMLAHKALITNAEERDVVEKTCGDAISVFGYPVDIPILEAWVRSREPRIDLSQRLAAQRFEKREPCVERVHFRISGIDRLVDATGQVVNIGKCGACVLTTYPLERGQALRIAGLRTTDAEEGVVRWVNRLNGKQYQAGVAFCV